MKSHFSARIFCSLKTNFLFSPRIGELNKRNVHRNSDQHSLRDRKTELRIFLCFVNIVDKVLEPPLKRACFTIRSLSRRIFREYWFKMWWKLSRWWNVREKKKLRRYSLNGFARSNNFTSLFVKTSYIWHFSILTRARKETGRESSFRDLWEGQGPF